MVFPGSLGGVLLVWADATQYWMTGAAGTAEKQKRRVLIDFDWPGRAGKTATARPVLEVAATAKAGWLSAWFQIYH